MFWFIEALKKYAVFTGRARRREYWYFNLFSFIFMMLALVLDILLSTVFTVGGIPMFGFILILTTLFMILPSLAVSIRRLHDLGKSGYWVLVPLGASLLNSLFGAFILGFTSIIELTPAIITTLSLIFKLFQAIYLFIAIWFLVWNATIGQYGSNKYGPDPLANEYE